MNWDETRQFLAPCFPEHIRCEMEMLLPGELREIRLRACRETVFVTSSRTVALPFSPAPQELETIVEALSEHSLYARTDETGQGYCTLRGGHRMGLCGRMVYPGTSPVLASLGSVCIRIAAQWPGCADPLMPRLADTPSMLIIGAPGSGKTTLLRDAACQLATGRKGLQVSLVDERGELAACVNGIPQLDVGCMTDVLSGMGKADAIPRLVRAMSPQVIITDELNGAADAAAILDASACGVSVCASVHGSSLREAASRPGITQLLERQVFGLYVLLAPDGGGQIAALYDRSGASLPCP